MIIGAYLFFTLYFSALIFIGIYCLSQFHLLYSYLFKKNKHCITGHQNSQTEWPTVTIQLPLYNEKYVVERLIENITKLDYPKDKLTIHILDDSTDDTLLISKQKVEEYQSKGFDIHLFHRLDRQGFKAGALKESMAHLTSEFVAIFDADFVPKPDFLRKTIPHFINPSIGVVQSRWEHINQNLSLLTEMQALQLNVHFTVEQQGRFLGNYLLQFNGTAGVWRTKTIEDAGGWEADTLTEDLDLSYRAQLKGWQILYLEKLGSPAELPSDIFGLKSQQFRWMKGGAENAKKLLKLIWASPLQWSKKLHATSHLLSSTIFVAVFSLGIFSVPLMYLMQYVTLPTHYLQIFLASFASIVVLYFLSNVFFIKNDENIFKIIFKFLFVFPIFMSISMALAFHNSIAVMQGWCGKKSPFVRTPKYGEQKESFTFKKSNYFVGNLNKISLGEALLTLYFVAALWVGSRIGVRDFFLLHIMLAFGYFSLFLYALKSRFSK
ncbi:MAG: glycosyltransferase [Saprospiraceae bacterium]